MRLHLYLSNKSLIKSLSFVNDPFYHCNFQSVIQHELYDNLQIYSFQLDEEDMREIKELETGIRKIIPVTKLSNGEVVIRDKESKLFPFDFKETYPNEM